MPPEKPAPETMQNTATSASFREDETDDGWIVLRAGTTPMSKPARGMPPRPPHSSRRSTMATAASLPGRPFDPAPNALMGRYLPARRGLRCDALPPQIHDADVYGFHPAFLASVYPPAANAAADRLEWFFAVRRPRQGHTHGDDGGRARARRAGPGKYVPAAPHERCVRDGTGSELGYRRVFRYREDDEAARRSSRTAWWMEEYGFGPHFPFGEHSGDEKVVVYKVYLRMAHR